MKCFEYEGLELPVYLQSWCFKSSTIFKKCREISKKKTKIVLKKSFYTEEKI